MLLGLVGVLLGGVLDGEVGGEVGVLDGEVGWEVGVLDGHCRWCRWHEGAALAPRLGRSPTARTTVPTRSMLARAATGEFLGDMVSTFLEPPNRVDHSVAVTPVRRVLFG